MDLIGFIKSKIEPKDHLLKFMVSGTIFRKASVVVELKGYTSLAGYARTQFKQSVIRDFKEVCAQLEEDDRAAEALLRTHNSTNGAKVTA